MWNRGTKKTTIVWPKLRALNQLKETLHEGTLMSMEEYRLRNEEELDAKTIHKKCVKAVTASSISDKGASASWTLLLPNVMEIEAFSLCCFY